MPRTTRGPNAAGFLAAIPLAVGLIRWLRRRHPMTVPTHWQERSEEPISPDEMDRLRAFAMRQAADPEAARFRAGVEAERAAGIPEERFIGRAELLARRRSARQH